MVAFFVPGYGVVGAEKKTQQTSRSNVARGYLGPVDDKSRSDTLEFPLNPESITRRRVPHYAEVLAARADYFGDYPQSAPSPIQWVRNPPETISFELLLVAGNDKDTEKDVEDELGKLRKMSERRASNPQGKSSEPTDLVFGYGKKTDRVRITSMEIHEERHTSQLKVARASVRLELKVVRANAK